MNEIKLVCFDFDGVFTNGQVFFNNSNIVKYYNVKDGMGIKLLKKKMLKLLFYLDLKKINLQNKFVNILALIRIY